MQIIVVKHQKQANELVGGMFARILQTHTHPVFGLATGGTPEGLYQWLRASDLDFRKAVAVNLDEYVGLPATDPHSYAYYMRQHLFAHKPFAHTFIPDGSAKDLLAAAAGYHQILKDHPRTIQLLGVGRNGHIGFNEPNSSFKSTTRVVALTPSTIAANARFFKSKDAVPTHALSMGISEIMAAEQIVLMAFGTNKATAVKNLVAGRVTPRWPASILQRHPHVVVVVDEAAAAQLPVVTLKHAIHQ